jgi:hypothetical protein
VPQKGLNFSQQGTIEMSVSSTASILRNFDWQFFVVRTVNLLTYCWNIFKKQSVKSSKFLVDSFSPNLYVFFEGSSVPVAARDYKQNAAGIPAVAAYYDRDTQAIYTDTRRANYHTLLFETVNLYHRDICLYDLTDFFNDIKFYGTTPASLDTWVAAWCLETGIYLDRKKSFTVRSKLLLENDSKMFSLWSTDADEKLEWTKLCRPPGLFHSQGIRHVDVSGNTVYMPTLTLPPVVDSLPVEEPPACPTPAGEESSKLE